MENREKNHSHHQREASCTPVASDKNRRSSLHLSIPHPLSTTTTIPWECVVYGKKEVAPWREKEACRHSSVVLLLTELSLHLEHSEWIGRASYWRTWFLTCQLVPYMAINRIKKQKTVNYKMSYGCRQSCRWVGAVLVLRSMSL